jgi:hypothetical protein
MTKYNIPPEALYDADDDDDKRRYDADDDDDKRRIVVLDKHALPRRKDDRNDSRLMKAAEATGPMLALAHLISKIFSLGAPTHIRATGEDTSLDVQREYNRATGQPELRVDINAPRQQRTELEKLREPGPTLERREETDPQAEESPQENRRKSFWLDEAEEPPQKNKRKSFWLD